MCEFARITNKTHTFNLEIETCISANKHPDENYQRLFDYFFQYNLNAKQLSFPVKIFVRSTSYVGSSM